MYIYIHTNGCIYKVSRSLYETYTFLPGVKVKLSIISVSNPSPDSKGSNPDVFIFPPFFFARCSKSMPVTHRGSRVVFQINACCPCRVPNQRCSLCTRTQSKKREVDLETANGETANGA